MQQPGPYKPGDSRYLDRRVVVRDEIVRVIQQLAWFAAVFKLPTKDTMTISAAGFDKPSNLCLRPSA
jgi:hypothetical protein